MKQRKIILSRKGFDSEYGGRPSPILPDGTMLSLPIPDDDECTRYKDLSFEGVSYLNIIRELGYNKNEVNCHLDPDLRFDATHRDYSWKACFGQSGAAASHLNSQNVGVGDIFLFFGWFRKTEYDSNGKLRYVKRAPDIHAIFGYLQVGEVTSTGEERAKFNWHPHAKENIQRNGLNYIFVADENVLGSVHPGSGVFKFNNKLQLTKQGMSRSRWELPECLTNIPMTYHNSNSLKENYFQSAMKGQEFVFDSSEEIEEWIVNELLGK
jgi:hypothetical protein